MLDALMLYSCIELQILNEIPLTGTSNSVSKIW